MIRSIRSLVDKHYRLAVALIISGAVHWIVICSPSPFAQLGKVATSPVYNQPAATRSGPSPELRI